MNFFFQNLTEIKGGLSKKKVFRKLDKKLNKIVVDFSQNAEEFGKFFYVYEILKKVNISIPKIYEVYWEKKIVVMEDFGNNTFEKEFENKDLYNLLKLAVDNLIIIQNSINKDNLINLEKYSYNHLKKEITEFVDYYIPFRKISNFPLDDFYYSWERVYNEQKFNFDSFTHNDFEFINLIFLDNKNLHFKCGIIDFQSAKIGFKGWDLFSILENPRSYFSRKYNEDLIRYFFENVNIESDFIVFRNQYYLLNLARQTRLLGRWVKLFNEGKKDYLKYLNSTKKRIVVNLGNIKDKKLKKIYEKVLIN
tara:strand:- start:299 stop:1219 length:921 start_codon:yes stop_codon:yes gene_type:complete